MSEGTWQLVCLFGTRTCLDFLRVLSRRKEAAAVRENVEGYFEKRETALVAVLSIHNHPELLRQSVLERCENER